MSLARARELREQRAKIHEDMKAILSTAEGEDRNLTDDERQTYDRMEAAQGELLERAERMERSQVLEDNLAEPQGRVSRATPETDPDPVDQSGDRELAFRAWCAPDRATDRQLEAAERVGLNPRSPELESRALDGSDTSAGGYSVQNELMRAFWDAQLWFANIRPFATVWRTATGGDLPLPTIDDTGNTGEIIGQNSAVETTSDPSFGQVTIGAFKYSSKAILVPVELLQDSFVNLTGYIGRKLGERIGRIQSAHFATGTGTGLPQGIVPASSVGVTAAATNAIVPDEVISLQHSLDIAYRPNARFVMHDSIAAVLRKLKDSNDHYLWEMSLQNGQPDRLLGSPVTINNGMASALASAAKPIVFGDLSNYYIRDAGDVILARSDQRWIDTHQVGFLAFQRTDAKGVSSATLKHLLMA